MDEGLGALLLLTRWVLERGVAAGLVIKAVDLDILKLQGELLVLRALLLQRVVSLVLT